MKSSRYSSSRQKACQQCSTAKAKCDRRPGRTCTRCSLRGLPCAGPSAETPQAPTRTRTRTNPAIDEAPSSPFSMPDSSFITPDSARMLGINTAKDLRSHPPSTPSTMTARTFNPADQRSPTTSSAAKPDTMDFSNLELVCPINAEDIKNRWIHAYIPIPGQIIKQYPPGVSGYIYSVLKSYTAIAVHGRGTLPPFIHPKQMTAQPPDSPLTTCLSLVRICSSNPVILPGSDDAAAGVLQREMHTLYDLRESYKYSNDGTLFAAFQAYLIYAMILFFRLNQSCNDQFRTIMTNLQELACATAGSGLVCAADHHHRRIRPRWEEWIVAEAKRRSLFVMYLFDSIISAQEGLPAFLGTELHCLPAPAGRLLWRAGSRYEWEREYHRHMAEWMEGSLAIEELWPTPEGMGEVDLARRRARIEAWLEDLDEYGTMLYAVVKCTHGC